MEEKRIEGTLVVDLAPFDVGLPSPCFPSSSSFRAGARWVGLVGVDRRPLGTLRHYLRQLPRLSLLPVRGTLPCLFFWDATSLCWRRGAT